MGPCRQLQPNKACNIPPCGPVNPRCSSPGVCSPACYRGARIPLAGGQPTTTLNGPKHTITCLADAPDCKALVSGARDGTVIFWDVGTGAARVTLAGHKHLVTAVAFTRRQGPRPATTAPSDARHRRSTATSR